MRTPVTSPAEPPALTPAWEASYPGEAAAARQVRAAVRSWLGGCPGADDVVLVASELAANAIAHSDSGQPGGTFTVRLGHACGDQVRVEVQDLGSAWDGDLTAGARQPRGLWLVTALSAACGTARGPGRSRLVWARVPDPASTVRTAPAP